jgi:hypothetical protein
MLMHIQEALVKLVVAPSPLFEEIFIALLSAYIQPTGNHTGRVPRRRLQIPDPAVCDEAFLLDTKELLWLIQALTPSTAGLLYFGSSR